METLMYAKAGCLPDWRRIEIYLNGERIEGALEASVVGGWVKHYRKVRGKFIMHGDVMDTAMSKGRVEIRYKDAA